MPRERHKPTIYTEAPNSIFNGWSVEKTVEYARLQGISGTDEQIIAFADFVETITRAKNSGMNHHRLMEVLAYRERRLEEVETIVYQDRSLLKRITKEFYAMKKDFYDPASWEEDNDQ